MAKFPITISINGGPQVTPESLGWSAESIVKKSFDADVATLRRSSFPTVGTSEVIADGAKLVFKVGDVRVFEGIAQPPRITKAGGVPSVTMQVLGPWWYLQNMTYHRAGIRAGNIEGYPPTEGEIFKVVTLTDPFLQIWDEVNNVWVPHSGSSTWYQWGREALSAGRGGSSANPIILDMGRVLTARGLVCDPVITSGGGFTSVAYRDLQFQVNELQGYVAAVYARTTGLGAAPLVFGSSILDTDTNYGSRTPRERPFIDRKMSDLFAELMAIAPEVCSRVNYEVSGPPEIVWDTTALGDERALSLASTELVSVDLQPRAGLVPRGVVVRYETDTPLTGQRGGKLTFAYERYPAGIVPQEPGVITFSQDYKVGTVRPGIAKWMYDSLSPLRASGSMVFSPVDLAGVLSLYPGAAYRFTEPQLSSAQVLIQETSWDLRTGQVRCAVGYPPRLDLQTVIDLRGWVQIVFGGWGWSNTVTAYNK